MIDWRTIEDIRREYGELVLNEEILQENPFVQFKLWFDEVLVSEINDPTAMVLSTVDERGRPDSRVVLLKGIENDTYVFYTNYESRKALQLRHTPYGALNFYWPQMARQVRIRGKIKRTSKENSDTYFSKRPIISQLSAMASPQSRPILNRQALEDSLNKLITTQPQTPIVRPSHWGGYFLIPDEMEFWQGRNNRLHDRFQYVKKKSKWTYRRLAP